MGDACYDELYQLGRKGLFPVCSVDVCLVDVYIVDVYLVDVYIGDVHIGDFGDVLLKLDYCNYLFYGSPMYMLERLQKVQHSAARLIFQCRKQYHISPLAAH